MVDCHCAHHRLTVPPLEVAGVLRCSLVHRRVTPVQAQRAREGEAVTPCWSGREALVEHAAAVSSRLATCQPSLLLNVVQSINTPGQMASMWKCLAFRR